MPRGADRLWLGCLLLAVGPACAAFEITGVGAQSTAMGGAFAAGVNSVEAVWHNPAGNARLRRWHGGTTQALLHPGLAHLLSVHGLVLTGPLQGGAVEGGLSLLSADGWREDVAVLGYGRPVHSRLALGVDVRTSAWRAGDLSHRVWSLDLGGIYEVGFVHPRAYLRLGLLLRDLNRANTAAGGQAAGRTPRGVVLAAAMRVDEQLFLVDVERRDGRTEVRVGYETAVVSLAGARFRMGGRAVGPGWSGQEVNAGIGHEWKRWHFDYAYAYPLRVSALGGMHRFSLESRW